MPDEPFLSRPDICYQQSFIEATREFHAEGTKPPWHYDLLEKNFDEFVALRLSYENDPPPGYVPQSDYWLIAEGIFAGRISIRHQLNATLLRYGGHIGYEIRPSMRRRGYGTLQCALGLQKTWELGITRALITCDDDNIGSIRIIEANGGILQDKVDNGRGVLTRRYWVEKPEVL